MEIENGVVNTFNFPGGEAHVKVNNLRRQPVTQLTAFIRNSDDIMKMLLVTDAMRRNGQKNINLVIPYVPYARQDRVMVPGEPLSIKVMADLINAQNYASVEIWDPHSDVTPALINNCEVIPQEDIVERNRDIILGGSTKVALVCPDGGARKKTLKVAAELGLPDIIFADKIRDVATGKITGTSTNIPSVISTNADLLIVDDICDGGFTFTELAKKLREDGFKGKIKLYVTHGIFSKGLSVFEGLIDQIYTANCWLDNTLVETYHSEPGHKTKLHIVSP